MKTLGRLKLVGMTLCVMLGMSSCLESEDYLNSFATGYVLQTSDEGDFLPQIWASAGEPLESVALKIDKNIFRFSKTDQNGYFYEYAGMDYMNSPMDTIKAGVYPVTFQGVNGKIEEVPVFLASGKSMGDIQGTMSLDEKKNLTVTMQDTVQNAEAYYLFFREDGGKSSYYLPLMPLQIKKDQLTVTVKHEDIITALNQYPGIVIKGKTYRVVLSALYFTGGFHNNGPYVMRKQNKYVSVVAE